MMKFAKSKATANAKAVSSHDSYNRKFGQTVSVVAQSVHHYSSFHPLYGVAMAQENVRLRRIVFVVHRGF